MQTKYREAWKHTRIIKTNNANKRDVYDWNCQ